MATNVDLSSGQQSYLIELYHNFAVLWDSTVAGYKDQAMRMKALKTMQTDFHAQFGVMLEINDLKTKLQSFRSTVSKEMTKIEQSTRSGAATDDIYIPKYRHWNELQFLTRVIKKRDSKSYLDGEQRPSPTPDAMKVEHSSMNWFTQTSQIPGTHLSDASSPPLLVGFPATVTTTHQQSLAPSSASTSSVEETRCSTPTDTQTDYRLQIEGRQQPSPSSIQQTLGKQSKKRKADNIGDRAMENLSIYLKSKTARMQANTAAGAVPEDPYVVWAKSLVNDLKTITDEKRRKLIQIKINRIVQDEIERQIEKEMPVDEFGD